MSIYPEGNRRGSVPKSFRYADNIRAGGNGDTCGAVPELVGVKIAYSIFLAEFLKIAGRRLRVHGIRRSVLRKDPFAHERGSLFKPELFQESECIRANVYDTRFSVFRACLIHSRCRGVLEVTSNGKSAVVPVYVFPLEAAQLASARSTISSKVDVYLPLQRLLSDAGEHTGKLLHSEGLPSLAFLPGERWEGFLFPPLEEQVCSI